MDLMLAPLEHGFKHADFRTWESRVVARAQAGDRAAHELLYRTFAPALYETIVRPRVRDAALADDVVAETFATVLTKLNDYVNEGKGFWSWLATVAIHKCIDALRRRNKANKREQPLYENNLDEAHISLDGPALLSRRLEHADIAVRVERCLQQIHPRYAQAIRLRFYDERERPECAAELAITVATFDVVLLRAVRAFREAWTQRPSYTELS